MNDRTSIQIIQSFIFSSCMNMFRKVTLLLITLLYPIQIVLGQPEQKVAWTIEELSSFTVLLINEAKSKSGTGTIIRHGGKYYILTAKHVRIFLDEQSKVLVKMFGKNHGTFILKQIIDGKLNIVDHPNADVSIIPLQLNKVDIDNWFYKNSLPSENIYKGEIDIGRERQLTFLGYPYIDITKPNRFMPMSFDCKYSSESQSYHLKVDDIEINCDVMFLDRISIEGASGGGLYFSVVRDISFLDSGVTQLVGIISGNYNVETRNIRINEKDEKFYESRFAFVMPSKYIWDLLNR